MDELNYQTLNTAGQQAVRDIVSRVCKPDMNDDAFFADVERARNDGRDDWEISGQHTTDRRPVVLSISDEWFA